MDELTLLKIMLEQYEKQNSYSQSEALRWAIEFIETRIENEKPENYDRE